jgi:hypothetical protein
MLKSAVCTRGIRQIAGVGHRGGVLLDLVAPDLEQEHTPGTACNVHVARVDLVQRRDRLMVAQEIVEVGLDLVVALLEFGQNREGLDRILAAQGQLGHAAQDHV